MPNFSLKPPLPDRGAFARLRASGPQTNGSTCALDGDRDASAQIRERSVGRLRDESANEGRKGGRQHPTETRVARERDGSRTRREGRRDASTNEHVPAGSRGGLFVVVEILRQFLHFFCKFRTRNAISTFVGPSCSNIFSICARNSPPTPFPSCRNNSEVILEWAIPLLAHSK